MSSVHDGGREGALGDLAGFRREFYRCLPLRADALFELLCTDGPVATLVGLSLAAEHRRGHGALYDGLADGRVEIARLRRTLCGLPLPRDDQGRITLAVDVSHWLRPDGACCADRLFCHTYARGKGQAQMIPGWPYSVVAALEPGRTSWTAILDAQRLGPADDATEVTATQVRGVIERLQAAGAWKPGDADILVVFDAGYDVTRLAFLLADRPVELLGRIRSDRTLCFPPPCRALLPASVSCARHRRAHGQTRGGVQAQRSGHAARAGGGHGQRHRPLWHRSGVRVGPAAPTADPPRRLGTPPRPATDHRGQPHPIAGGPAPRRSRPETGVAMAFPPHDQ